MIEIKIDLLSTNLAISDGNKVINIFLFLNYFFHVLLNINYILNFIRKQFHVNSIKTSCNSKQFKSFKYLNK